MERLSHDLDLTTSQQDEIEEILRSSERKLFALRLKHMPEIEEVINQSFILMKDKLTDKQKEKLEDLQKRTEKAIADILTEDQIKIYRAIPFRDITSPPLGPPPHRRPPKPIPGGQRP